MDDSSHLENGVFLTGRLHVEVRDGSGAPCAGEEVVVFGCGFV